MPEEKIEVIYNWVDENAVQPVAKAENPLYEEFGLSCEAFTVVYAGNLGNAQNIGIILDAAKRFNENENKKQAQQPLDRAVCSPTRGRWRSLQRLSAP